MKDPLLQTMMMDSKQFIKNPAFNDVLMNTIMKKEEKKFFIKKGLYYSIPALLILAVLIIFARPILQQIQLITLQLTSETILHFFKGITDYLQLILILLLVAIVPRMFPSRATA